MRRNTDRFFILIVLVLVALCGLGLWLRPDAPPDAREAAETANRQSTSEGTEASSTPASMDSSTTVPSGVTPTAAKLPVFDCIPMINGYQTGFVTAIIDGDTIYVQIDGIEYSVRYIGIDAPELDDREPLAEEAKQLNASLVDGKTVTLVRDVSNTDIYGRLLRYVLVEDVFVNYELVSEGLAAVKAYYPDISCHETLLSAQD